MTDFSGGIPDQNLQVPATIGDLDVTFYSVRQDPFEIYGLYRPTDSDTFRRLPDELTKGISENMFSLGRKTAGGRVRFSTDSPYVAIRAVYNVVGRLPHMPLSGSAGFDLYLDDLITGSSHYCKTFMPPLTMDDSYESVIDLGSKKMRSFTVHFPGYSAVRALWIGVAPNSSVQKGLAYRDLPPIVYYGSSITQGGCASRPGNYYENIISQHLNIDHINLGFSGNGRAEQAMADYMAALPMSAFVCDYDHNAPNVQHLVNTHLALYQTIRAAYPNIPYIMLSKPDFLSLTDPVTNPLRQDVIVDTYRYARQNGDRNVYYIDGASLFRGPYAEMTTVDRCHPNDLGFALMAEAIESELRTAFGRME